jgi:hypothetical protein
VIWRGIALDGGGLNGGRKLRSWIVSHISCDQEDRISWMVVNIFVYTFAMKLELPVRGQLALQRILESASGVHLCIC